MALLTPVLLPIVGTHKKSPQTDAETFVNLFAVKVGTDNRGNPIWDAYMRPGLRLKYQAPGNLGIRNIHPVAGKLFAVRGNTLSELDGGTMVSRGILASQGGLVGMSDNGQEVIVVDGTKGYGYTLGMPGSFSEITGFPGGGNQAVFAASRIFSVGPGTNRVYNSALPELGGVFSWPSLNFVQKTSTSGPVTALASLGQIVFFLGPQGHEVWKDAGRPNTPLIRSASGSNIGISAAGSAAVYNQTVYWLGGQEGEGVVYASSGGTPQRISNSQIEAIIAKIPGISDARAYIYQEEGQAHYILSFMQGRTTLAFNLTMTAEEGWGLRVSRDPVTSELFQFIGACQCSFGGMNLVGDYRNGNIYEMSLGLTSDNGDLIYWERAFPAEPQESQKLTTHKTFELMMDMGDGPLGECEKETEVRLDYSENGGVSYMQLEPQKLGRQGEYNKRLVWFGLGATIRRNYRISGTTDRKTILRKAVVNV